MHIACTIPVMVKHAQRKQNNGRKRGVAVNNRFRVDVYFKTREDIARVDEARKVDDRSRSAFISAAAIEKADKVLGGAQ